MAAWCGEVAWVGGSTGIGLRAGFESCPMYHHGNVLGKLLKPFVAQFPYQKKSTGNSCPLGLL